MCVQVDRRSLSAVAQAQTFSPDSRALAGCSAAPQIEPDNKEIVKLKAFPAAVSGGRLYNTRACIMYQVLDSMWGGRIECVISL